VFQLDRNSTSPSNFDLPETQAKTIGFCWLEICMWVIIRQISSQWKLVALASVSAAWKSKQK
jgi:hypothetical protein